MNINININIAIQPATEAIVEQPALESAECPEAKAVMIIKRLAYRQRIADKLRATFGDDTANHFLAGVL